jgi:transposase
MKMIELIPMVQDEKLSENYLRERGILKAFKNCEHCNSSKLGMIRSDRWKCYSCKAEWSRRRYSILSLVRIKYSEFLICLKFFEIEMTAEKCSKELNIERRTIQDLYTEFRKCICNDISEEFIIFENKSKKSIGEIRIQLLGYQVRILLPAQEEHDPVDAGIEFTRRRIPNGPVIYNFEFSKLRGKINMFAKTRYFSKLGIFWRFANPRLTLFKGTTPSSVLLYLKEIEFRYNHNEILFELLINKIVQKYRWLDMNLSRNNENYRNDTLL